MKTRFQKKHSFAVFESTFLLSVKWQKINIWFFFLWQQTQSGTRCLTLELFSSYSSQQFNISSFRNIYCYLFCCSSVGFCSVEFAGKWSGVVVSLASLGYIIEIARARPNHDYFHWDWQGFHVVLFMLAEPYVKRQKSRQRQDLLILSGAYAKFDTLRNTYMLNISSFSQITCQKLQLIFMCTYCCSVSIFIARVNILDGERNAKPWTN